MTWRPIDFQGIVELDRRVIDQLDHYLQEKETRLAHQILDSLHTANEPLTHKLPIELPSLLRLSDAVEGFTKKVRLFTKNKLNELPAHSAQHIIKEMNAGLWEYTEVLEGCIVELFQQIKQVNIDRWHRSLSKVVMVIKEMLIHRMDDLMWTIRRLDPILREFRLKTEAGHGWRRWIRAWNSQLDPRLLSNLSQSEKFLKIQYEAFSMRYAEYVRINVKVESHLDKMKSYPVLALLEIHDQNLYIDVFRLLKFLELNLHDKGVLADETVRSLRNLASVDGVIKVFRAYYHGLEDAFFNSSHELKSFYDEEGFDEHVQRLRQKLNEYQHELQHFMATMGRYRDFILKTNPNPYVRSRLGFTEWTVGPEPEKSKELLNLIYKAEELKRWYEQFLASLNQDFVVQHRRETNDLHEIDGILHEMAQPLISQAMMRNRVERLLFHIKDFNEVGNLHEEAVNEVGTILSKAMREDWKYHVLYEFPLFHEIFRLHKGLEIPITDPAHAFRLERFRHLCGQIEEWIRKGDVYAHIHEIELDMNDMKIYLQDFLATVQRLAKEKNSNPFLDEAIHKLRQQLLEYRYLFGKFFFELQTKETDGQQLRNQFLFVDQYFESAELILHELAISWRGEEH